MTTAIRDIDIRKDDNGEIQAVRLVFGPHHFVELHSKDTGGVDFVLGTPTMDSMPMQQKLAANSRRSSTRCAAPTPAAWSIDRRFGAQLSRRRPSIRSPAARMTSRTTKWCCLSQEPA
jgi:hypothetical protein